MAETAEALVPVRVFVLWPAGYSVKARQDYLAISWTIRDGCLVIITRAEGDPTRVTVHHIPMTSIAKWEVGG